MTVLLRIAVLLVLLSALCGCASGPSAQRQSQVIAVWDIDDLSPMGSGYSDMGELLSARIIEALRQTGTYEIVERQKLMLALEEQRIGSSSLADETVRLKLGRLLGVRSMVFGGYQVVGGSVRIDLRLIEVETGKVRRAVHRIVASSDVMQWMKAAGDAVPELIRAD